MAKKIIYLSLKDLKELGIIKPRKRRRTNKKRLVKNTFTTDKPTPSDHMVGSTQYFNTSNLNTENVREQNRALMLTNDAKELAIKNNNTNTNDVNNKLLQLERQQNNQQNNYYYLTGEMAKNQYNIDRNMGYAIDDNVDVSPTYGSDSFIGEGTPETVQDAEDTGYEQETSVTLPQPQQPYEKYIEEEGVKEGGEIEPIDTTQTKTKKEKNEENRIKLRNELKKLGVSGPILDSKNQTEMSKTIKTVKKEISILIGEYVELGGESNKVISSTDKNYIKNKINKLKTQPKKNI